MAADTIYRVRKSGARFEVVEYTVYDSGHERLVDVVEAFDNEPDATAQCDKLNTEQSSEAPNYHTG
jgi:hypothetical protein